MTASPQSSDLVLDATALSTYLGRYENTKMFDTRKNALIEDLLTYCHTLSERLTQERTERDIERKWTEENIQLSQENTVQLQDLLNRDPFVLVLIDGADVLFRNTFLRDGDLGGRRCAALLHKAVNEYVFANVDDLPAETKVYVRMYADIEDLARTCLQTGIIDHSMKIKSFARGFVQDKTAFDIINVYSQGREAIIDKVEGQLLQHVYDYHCRQVILGCSDGSIYARILKKIGQDPACHHRISIFSGVPLSQEFGGLPFQTTRFPDIFRNTEVEVHKGIDYVMDFELPALETLKSVIGTPLGMLTPPLSTPTLSVRSDSRLERLHPRTSSIASSVTSMENVTPKQMTWATVSKKASALPVTVSEKLISKEQPAVGIRRNKHGQRLDPPPPEYKKEEVNRLKKLKLCNAHYLRGDCIYAGTKCTHEHSYKCTKGEVETLRLVARMSACIHDSECSDEKCIYGHVCPFPEAKEGSMRGKGCLNGDSCRFPPHMHGMDMIPVRCIKVT